MITALFITIALGLIIIFLSLENDKLRKTSLEAKKAEEDRLYKLSVIKDVQGKIAYLTDPEKIIDIILISLRNLFDYSAASSITAKNSHLIFKIYCEETIGPEYLKKVEEAALTSFEKLVGKRPSRIDKKLYGLPIDNASKSIYSSSFHIPLIANNKVLALIHLSSFKPNAYSDMSDLHELIDAASTALTHFDQAVEEETKKLSSLIGSINDGLLMSDNNNNLLTVNDAARKILGITKDLNFLDILNIFPPDFNLQSKINQVFLTRNPHFEKEIQIGSSTLNISINPIGRDKVSVILHDMTDYKTKEMLKEDLIHIMVHELRAPMTTIKDSAELIITSQNTLEENKKLRFLEMIHQQSKKVLGQIGSILDTAKLDAGKLVLQKTNGDIAKLIKDEIQNFMPQAERNNISVSFDIAANALPEIAFDEIRISQVIDNLLSNSLKFTPSGGKIKVEIDYKAIPPVLDGTSPMGEFLSLDKYIVISVSDSGVGITPEQQKSLFAKYTQAQNSSEKIATQGTGLGLYLARGIVESHEGRIWVKSAPGQGTTFSFSLPATQVAKTAQDAPTSNVANAKPAPTPLSTDSAFVATSAKEAALTKAGLSKLSQTVN